MRFEAREVTNYTIYVDHESLQEGAVYFIVSFMDTDLLIPELEPIVFIGRNLVSGDIDQIYFQDFPHTKKASDFRHPAILKLSLPVLMQMNIAFTISSRL